MFQQLKVQHLQNKNHSQNIWPRLLVQYCANSSKNYPKELVTMSKKVFIWYCIIVVPDFGEIMCFLNIFICFKRLHTLTVVQTTHYYMLLLSLCSNNFRGHVSNWMSCRGNNWILLENCIQKTPEKSLKVKIKGSIIQSLHKFVSNLKTGI